MRADKPFTAATNAWAFTQAFTRTSYAHPARPVHRSRRARHPIAAHRHLAPRTGRAA